MRSDLNAMVCHGLELAATVLVDDDDDDATGQL